MVFEQTSPGNPHQLTIRQHIFPKASIKRFINTNGRVEVFNKIKNKVSSLTPNDMTFCAKRVWDQRAESGYMLKIEDSYQAIANDVVAGKIHTLSPEQNLAITDMFALWHERYFTNQSPSTDHQFSFVKPGIIFSKEDRERLEKMHISSISANGSFAGRHTDGVVIQMRISRFRETIRNQRWGIQKTTKGELITPDVFAPYYVLPISPTILLSLGNPDGDIDQNDLTRINDAAIESSQKYYFARDLSLCPKS